MQDLLFEFFFYGGLPFLGDDRVFFFPPFNPRSIVRDALELAWVSVFPLFLTPSYRATSLFLLHEIAQGRQQNPSFFRFHVASFLFIVLRYTPPYFEVHRAPVLWSLWPPLPPLPHPRPLLVPPAAKARFFPGTTKTL